MLSQDKFLWTAALLFLMFLEIIFFTFMCPFLKVSRVHPVQRGVVGWEFQSSCVHQGGTVIRETESPVEREQVRECCCVADKALTFLWRRASQRKNFSCRSVSHTKYSTECSLSVLTWSLTQRRVRVNMNSLRKKQEVMARTVWALFHNFNSQSL